MAGVAMHGRLSLCFERPQNGSSAALRFLVQEPPWRVVRAFPTEAGASLIHLNNISGGILGGDRLELQIELSAGVAAQITSTGATRIYRSRPGQGAAVCSTTISLGKNSLLEFLPDALIPYAGSSFEQHTSIDLAPGATLFWWEVVAPGRAAAGEVFRYRGLRLQSEICAQGLPFAMEHFHLEPGQRPLDSPARLAGDRYLTTFFICKVGPPAGEWRGLEQELAEIAARLTRPGEIRWGASALARHGIIVRGLSRESRWTWPGLYEFWRAAKWRLLGQQAVLPRKVY